MPCPTCDHTLDGIGYGMFHCPRCGTLLNCPADGAVHVPALVRRCRDFEATLTGSCALHMHEWRTIGIRESINRPGDRAKVAADPSA